MLIQKYQAVNGYCIIKSNTYAHTVEYVNSLVSIAKQDFPGLQDKDINVKVFNSDRWKSQTGIEFDARNQSGYFIKLKLVNPPIGEAYEVIDSCSHSEYQLIYELPHVFN